MEESVEHLGTQNAKKRMIEALKASLGVVTPALNVANVGRTTYYEWLQIDPEFKKEVEGLTELTIDFVESQLYRQIQAGEVASTLFFMKTKGKKRGFQETKELDIKINKPVVFDWNTVDDGKDNNPPNIEAEGG